MGRARCDSAAEQARRSGCTSPLVPPGRALGLTRVVSSDAVRCVDSVRPYVDATGVPFELQPVLSEDGHLEQPLAVEKVTGLLADGARTVVCSHRPVFST